MCISLYLFAGDGPSWGSTEEPGPLHWLSANQRPALVSGSGPAAAQSHVGRHTQLPGRMPEHPPGPQPGAASDPDLTTSLPRSLLRWVQAPFQVPQPRSPCLYRPPLQSPARSNRVSWLWLKAAFIFLTLLLDHLGWSKFVCGFFLVFHSFFCLFNVISCIDKSILSEMVHVGFGTRWNLQNLS